MAKIGKRSLLLVILTAAGMNVLAQNTNPYEKFGYKSEYDYKLPMDKLFRIINSDTTSEIKAMVIDFEKSIAYLLGESDALIKTFWINPDDVLIWLNPDPKASKYPHQSPYAYCSNNPIMKIDPNGMEDDWVQNSKTGQYQWMDNVKSPANTPNGYRYVGANGESIVRDLGIPNTFEPQNSNPTGEAFIGAFPMPGIVASKTRTKVNTALTVNANISLNPNNVAANNALGITFNGVTFTGYMSQKSIATNPDLELNYSGYLEVGYGNNGRYTAPLVPSQSYIVQQGYTPTQASVTIPANQINNSKTFSNAHIRAGATNNQVHRNDRIESTWSLQRYSPQTIIFK
ncbi:MAG: hypothetical protein LBO06_02055 [Bacteroidales bacterium]|jgi:hypothetical protein|nr:hypothetical protein [Bacteroidales bacterium]